MVETHYFDHWQLLKRLYSPFESQIMREVPVCAQVSKMLYARPSLRCKQRL